MRIAALVLGLILMLVLGLQSCAVTVGGSLSEDQATAEGGALGLFIALLFLVGAAFALGVPLISLIAFILAGIIGLLGGSSTPFADLAIWGIASFVLAIVSFFGWREKKKRDAESQARVV